MKIRITYALAILGSVLLGCLGTTVFAQEKAKPQAKQKAITISPKEGKNEKVTIIVDGDNITVNGKPITEYDGDDIVIRKKNIEQHMVPYAYARPGIRAEPYVYVTPRSKIAITKPPGTSWNYSYNGPEFEVFDNKALLGVITEKDEKGAKITEVMKESAAAKAGLLKGDIITKVDGKKVSDPEELSDAIEDKKPNEEVTIAFLRDKKERTLKVKLGERKSSYSFSAPRIEKELYEPFREFDQFHGDNFFRYNDNRRRLGVRIQEIEDSSGVKVLEVEEESVAEKSGIKRDDVITEIDGKKVKDMYSARDAMRESRDKSSYTVRVLRNGSPINIDVKIPKNLKKTDL